MIENPVISHSRVEMVDISKLKMHPKNVEIYGEEDITVLAQSIDESGWIKPLTVNPNYEAVSGNRRLQAAILLGYTELPVEVENFASEESEMERLLRENEGRGKTPEQQIREGMTWENVEKARGRHGGDRRSEDFQDTNICVLKGEIIDIIARRVGLGSGETYRKGKTVVTKIDEELATGDVKERGKLLHMKLNDESINAATKLMQNYKQIDDDEAQRLREEEEERVRQEELEKQRYLDVLRKEEALRPRGVQPGQVWRLGRHLLYCGDSASKQFIDLCKQKEVRFAFADPPYNAGVDEEWDKGFVWNHDYLFKVAPIVAVTPGISAIKDFMRKVDMPYKWSMSYWINNGMTRGAIGFGNWMYVALFSEGSLYRNGQDLVRIEDKDMGLISITGGDHDGLKHKGRKPIELLCHIINLFTEQGETVIDPFLGTGTTLIASERSGRACIGAELNIAYCESIIKRWVIETEQEAVLV